MPFAWSYCCWCYAIFLEVCNRQDRVYGIGSSSLLNGVLISSRAAICDRGTLGSEMRVAVCNTIVFVYWTTTDLGRRSGPAWNSCMTGPVDGRFFGSAGIAQLVLFPNLRAVSCSIQSH